MRHTDLR